MNRRSNLQSRLDKIQRLLETRQSLLSSGSPEPTEPTAPRLADTPDPETERAERSLHEFVRQAWSQVESAPFIDNPHIQGWCLHLEAVTESRIMRLLGNVPPGCSKSLLTCVFWPMWVWIRNPAARWMFVSYDQQLSTRDSVKCRTLLESDWYQDRWGDRVQLKRDQNRKTYYETSATGWRLATSPGGHGTGEHPDYLVFDDINNVKQAESELERQKAIDFHTMTAPTRGVSRGVRRVGIQQRCHTLDWSGYVLANEKLWSPTNPAGWVHYVLPMRFEAADPKTGKPRMPANPLGWKDWRTTEGELLAPNQFPEAAVAEMEQALREYGTSGQLQQRPAPREGGMFKAAWLEQVVDVPPEGLRYVRYWDKAHTAGGGCWTCGSLVGTDGQKWYVTHEVRGQWSPHDRNERIRQTAAEDEKLYGADVALWIEQEASGDAIDAKEIMAAYLAAYAPQFEKPTTGKEHRAEGLASQCQAGNVILVRNPRRPWVSDDEEIAADEALDAWRQEFILFPRGAYLDRVDATSGAFRKSLDHGLFDRTSVRRAFTETDEAPLF